MDTETVQENEIQVTDIRAARNVFSKVGFAFFMLAAISMVIQLAVIYVLNRAFPEGLQSSLQIYAAMLLPVYLIATPVCIYLLRRIEPRTLEQKSISFGSLLIFLLMCLPIMYGGNFLGSTITEKIAEYTGTSSSESLTSLIMGSDLLSNFIFVGLLAPIIEEILFRKLLIDRIVVYGEGVAVVTSALMFGMFHGNFTQFFYAFGLGLMFAYVYCRTGKLRYSIALHMTINTLGAVLAPFIVSKVDLGALQRLGEMEADDPGFTDIMADSLPGLITLLIYGGVLLIMAIIGFVLLIIRRKRFVLEKPALIIPEGKRFSTIWMNIGMFLFIAACMVLFAYNIVGKTL